MLRPIDRLLAPCPTQPIALVERLKRVALSEELDARAIAQVCGAFFSAQGAWFSHSEDMICITYENRRLGVRGAVVRTNGLVSIVRDDDSTSHLCDTTRDLMLLLCRHFVRDEAKAEACVWALNSF